MPRIFVVQQHVSSEYNREAEPTLFKNAAETLTCFADSRFTLLERYIKLFVTFVVCHRAQIKPAQSSGYLWLMSVK